jgi:hypothetical protein
LRKCADELATRRDPRTGTTPWADRDFSDETLVLFAATFGLVSIRHACVAQRRPRAMHTETFHVFHKAAGDRPRRRRPDRNHRGGIAFRSKVFPPVHDLVAFR